MSVEQLIEDATAHELREILERRGYCLPALASERYLRGAVLGDYEAGLIGGKEIRAVLDDRPKRIEAANRIIADQVRALARQHAEIAELRAEVAELRAEKYCQKMASWAS